MLTLSLVVLGAMLTGILTGLLPALPVYIGPFILYYFNTNLPLEYLLIFWLVVVSGSQFFGSVATITTRIPGEDSALVYLKDLNGLTLVEKQALLYKTAQGSLLAGILSTVFVYILLQYVNLNSMPYLASVKFQIIVYTLTIASFLFVNRRIVWTLMLLTLGILISPQSNYTLHPVWFEFTKLFSGFSFFMVLLGILIIPEIYNQYKTKVDLVDEKYQVTKDKFSFIDGIRSSIIGMLAGLIPGPSATTAAVAAYRTAGKDVKNKIVAAETANNGSVISCALPLLAFALPINQNTIMMSNLADIRSIFLPSAIFDPSFLRGFTVLDITAIVLLLALVVYYFLSTHLINWYVDLVVALHHRMKFILFAVVGVLIAADLYASETTTVQYFSLLGLFTLLGLYLKKKNVSPIPLLFAIILGDKLIWLYVQSYKLYF
jgi:putative tricarboxylic transport membrane protein